MEQKAVHQLTEDHTTSAQLRFITFNILAPCYNILRNRGNESVFEDLYTQRTKKVIETVKEIKADVICLQEVWFKGKVKEQFERALSSTYEVLYLQRTSCKSDGVAIWFNREFKVTHQASLVQDNVGNRVALLLELESVRHKPLIVVNTHLTFPHNVFDEKVLRLKQIAQITDGIDKHLESNEITEALVVICGDLNCPAGGNDVVYDHLLRQGYTSSFRYVHGREPGVTHLNHNNEEVPVDFVWFKNITLNKPYVAVDAYVHPRELSDLQWPKNQFVISDHRPVVATLQLEQ